jgi:hypothetical protein
VVRWPVRCGKLFELGAQRLGLRYCLVVTSLCGRGFLAIAVSPGFHLFAGGVPRGLSGGFDPWDEQ